MASLGQQCIYRTTLEDRSMGYPETVPGIVTATYPENQPDGLTYVDVVAFCASAYPATLARQSVTVGTGDGQVQLLG